MGGCVSSDVEAASTVKTAASRCSLYFPEIMLQLPNGIFVCAKCKTRESTFSAGKYVEIRRNTKEALNATTRINVDNDSRYPFFPKDLFANAPAVALETSADPKTVAKLIYDLCGVIDTLYMRDNFTCKNAFYTSKTHDDFVADLAQRVAVLVDVNYSTVHDLV